MSITSYTATPIGNGCRVTVTSDLGGTVYYHWYSDGSYFAATAVAYVDVPLSGQERIECIDTTDVDFDPIANAPAGFPAVRTLEWVRSIDTSVSQYRVQERVDGGDWETVALVNADSRWAYRYLTGELTDLADYEWRAVPLSAAGADGTPAALDSETVVRRPDAPSFTVAFNEGASTVTFSELT